MRLSAVAVLLVLSLAGLADALAQDEATLSPCEQVVTNENQLAGVFDCNTFSMPSDPLQNRAWLIDPQFLWADFASLPAEFGTVFAQSQDQLQALSIVKVSLTRFLLTGEAFIEFPASTNTLILDAAAGYSTNQVDSASRSALSTWRQWIACGEISQNTSPTLSLDVALADVQDKAAYDAEIAAEEAACEEAQAASNFLQAGMGMLMDEESGGSEEIESIDCSATNVFQIIAVTRTAENGVTVKWNSQCNAIYRIDYASSLSTNTTWQALHDNYPSHGTSTFWTDTGDYLQEPAIEHPKNVSQRFYRISYLRTNSVAPPTVNVTFPTNGMAVSGDVTVSVTSASSTLPIRDTYLYVDGEQMDYSEDGTNFVINTCEWANGPHTLFATVKGQSRFTGPPNSPAVDVTYAASAYVPVTFSNFISRIAFSQPFFEPALGQTQQVTAAFSTNADWTFQIQDEDANTVRNASGTGASMVFNWDGKGDGGSNIADGVYYYVISAQSTGGLSILTTSSTTAPKKPPTAPIKGSPGKFGVAYWDFPTCPSFPVPPNGLPLSGNPGKVEIGGSYGNLLFSNVAEIANSGKGFASVMKKKAWKVGFNLTGSQFRDNDLRRASLGGNEKFATVNLGFFMTHGTYGTSPDYHADASQTLQTYTTSDNSADASAPWIRMSEYGFGGSLRWMGLLTCNNLRDENFFSMFDAGALPITTNLHLLCGTTTVSYVGDKSGQNWAVRMFRRGFLWQTPPETVKDAWFNGARETYEPATNIQNTVIFRVVGWDNCFNDTLQSYAGGTSDTLDWQDGQVWP